MPFQNRCGLREQRQRGNQQDDEHERYEPLERGTGGSIGGSGHRVADAAEGGPPAEVESWYLYEYDDGDHHDGEHRNGRREMAKSQAAHDPRDERAAAAA